VDNFACLLPLSARQALRFIGPGLTGESARRHQATLVLNERGG